MAAKIYRINYKSDFILTLNSDAGWMTPFCIKFWTGAPSQAFFVGWDGTTYTHCSYDPSEPTKLVVQFDDHHLPIGDLKLQIAYHFTVADFPNDTEDEVINPANITVDKNGEQAQVMLDFTGETAPEIQFSLPAYANEAQRIANEQQRIAAEEQRITDEQTRISHEETRISQEQTRQDNEAQRIRNEQTRINQEEARVREFATLKHDAQDATAAANDAASLANQKAQLAADKAQLAADKAALAQDAAALANEKAQLAAAKAALANDAAALANQKAQLAKQKAEYAQTQGDYAKQQGDYAKQKGDDAATQMQQQAQAFSEAQAARQTAYEQAEGTESGSEAGDGSRWGAFKTNEAARDAKVDAKVADITNLQKAVTEGAVYDISANHLTEGVPTKYANLSAALGVDGVNVPVDKRKGGMSVKYIQSSAQSNDNKYVQYRCIADEFTTDVTKWQGVTSEVKKESKDLVESGAVAGEFSSREGITSADFSIKDEENYEIARFEGGDIKTKNFDSTGVNQKLNGIEDGAQVNDVDEGDADCDFSVKDESEHEIFKVVGGYPKTKKFDGKNVLERINALEPIPIQKKIFCIGDSLTYAGGAIPGSGSSIWEKELNETFAEQYLKFVNYGVGGENSATILGRVSVIPYVIIEDVIIPATTTAVEIKIKSSWLNGEGNYRSVAPLLQGDSGLNPVLIDNIQGSISYTNSKYYFTRTTVGDARNIPQGTIILTNSGLSYPYGVIVWIGTNDGIAITTQDLIDNVKKTLLKFRTDKYLVIGVYYWNYLQQTDWTLAMREEQEKKLTAEFGDNFVNFRQYAISNAISDAVALGYLVPGVADGLVTGDEESFPTPTDITQMAAGYVPQSLRKDNIHLNNAGYKILAYYLTRKINRLNF